MVDDLSTLSDEDIAEGLDAIGQGYGDTLTQHRSETALYGDSWPGAQIELAELKKELDRWEAEWDRRHPPRVAEEADDSFGPPPGAYDDIPF